MKTFYTIAFSMLSFIALAQQSISFEDSEGFITGNINGQGSWISTPTGDVPANVTHQSISTDLASDRDRSLKIVKETVFGTQSEPIIGGFYNLPQSLTFSNFSVSFDINISQLDGSAFGFQAMESTEELYIARLDFDKTGEIKILDAISGVQTLVSTAVVWSPNIWYRCKVVGTSGQIRYYLNNVLIYEGTAVSPVNINQLRFVHNNAAGTAYIDQIEINNELIMAVNESKTNIKTIQVYPNPASDIVKIKSKDPIKKIEVFDFNGKHINSELKEGQINIETWPAGEYILHIETGKKNSIEKIIKK